MSLTRRHYWHCQYCTWVFISNSAIRFFFSGLTGSKTISSKCCANHVRSSLVWNDPLIESILKLWGKPAGTYYEIIEFSRQSGRIRPLQSGHQFTHICFFRKAKIAVYGDFFLKGRDPASIRMKLRDFSATNPNFRKHLTKEIRHCHDSVPLREVHINSTTSHLKRCTEAWYIGSAHFCEAHTKTWWSDIQKLHSIHRKRIFSRKNAS